MSQIMITPLPAEQTETAIGILARAFVTNPLHVAALGPSSVDSNEVFFRVAATDGSHILGVAHWVRAPACQFSAFEKVLLVAKMIHGLGLGPALKVLSWVSTWSKHDPSEPHSHLGPIAVDPGAQGRHIGTKLMQRFCLELDRTGMVAYLETDRTENVGFYKRFGFAVTETATVIGVETYFMRRG
jgi:ribosomal protein S18 acetylase RimI-like enzyme